MTTASRKATMEIVMCGDLAVCTASLLLASTPLYRSLWQAETLLLTHPVRQLFIILALGFFWHLSLLATGTYKSYRLASYVSQMKGLLRGTTLVSFWTAGWLWLSGYNSTMPLQKCLLELTVFWTLALSGLLVTRIGARLIMRALRRRGRNLRNVLVIGTNRRAIALVDSLLGSRELGYRLVGFVDDFWQFVEAPECYKQLLLGDSEKILELLRSVAVDEVIIALPIASSYHVTEEIIEWCRQQGIMVRYEGSLFNIQRDADPDGDDPLRLITLCGGSHDEWSVAGKRLADLLLSAVAITVTLPVLACVALAVKLTSPGPVLFSQDRVGIGKHRFRMFKIRTMVSDAEALMDKVEHLNESHGPTFKLEHDPRITRLGAFLRKTSIDELPQLFNVLIGDMSLVGPRPLPLRDYRGFSKDWYRRRFSVKPGMTCLWQVSGRSSIGFDRWMELDMDYIDRWSLWLDCKILLKTIPAVVRGSGAM